MSQVADFTDSELDLVRQTLKERYGGDIAIEQADVEIRLSPGDRELTECPAVFWAARDANFIVVKSGDKEYRCQFFYRNYDQFGTGRETYDELGECVVTLLQVQADHEAEHNKESGA